MSCVWRVSLSAVIRKIDNVGRSGLGTWFPTDGQYLPISGCCISGGRPPTCVKEVCSDFPMPPSMLTVADMLHVDIGITAMGMKPPTPNTSATSSVLTRPTHPNPSSTVYIPPTSCKTSLDTVWSQERRGDEVLFAIFDDMKEAKLNGLIYSHPIGDYGHSAGAIIGMAQLAGQ